MHKLLLGAYLTVLLAVPADAATIRLKIRQPYQAGQDEGNLVAVRGRAHLEQDALHAGTDVSLIEPDGRRSFIGFIPKTNEYLFPDLAAVDGKTVIMYGVIEIYESLPTTQLLTRGQLRLAQ